MVRAAMIRWLLKPAPNAWQALLFILAAIWIPTILRMAVAGSVTGCEFTPYLPFVLIAAMLLPWWEGALVAAGSVVIMGGFVAGTPAFEMPCFTSAAGIFLAASTVVIGVAVLVRYLIIAMQKRGADESLGGIVFSLEKGEVWASWYGQGPPVLLGSQRKVAEMMEDFLAQVEVGKRLCRSGQSKGAADPR
jgi:hypothetical protein